MEDRCYGYLSTCILLFAFALSLVAGQSSLKCNTVLTAEVEGDILANGDLRAEGNTYTKDFYERINATHFRVCVCTVRNCLRRCCPPGQTFVGRNCTQTSVNVHIDVYAGDYLLQPNYNMSLFTMVYGDVCMNGKYRLNPTADSADAFYLFTNGSLSVPTQGALHKVEDFCLEYMDDVENVSALVCFQPDATNEDGAFQYKAYPIGMIISVPFLLATFLVYALIPELRNLHGKNMMCHVVSLATGYIVLVTVQLGGSSLELELCIACAFLVQFAFLATFFWLNVMSFDIWWAFSGFGGLRGSAKDREFKRFLLYSLYAWGGPLIMMTVSLVMDLAPNIPSYLLKPGFGTSKCFFHTKEATLAYFYGPIAVIILCNIVLFILTAVKIFIVKKETQVLSGNDSRRNGRNDEANKQRFILYLKLFLVMGVNWMMEVISWALGDGPEFKWIWFISDICNTLQGIIIFFIFVWKPRIKKLVLSKLFPHLLPREAETQTSSIKMSMSMSRNSSANDNVISGNNSYSLRKTSKSEK